MWTCINENREQLAIDRFYPTSVAFLRVASFGKDAAVVASEDLQFLVCSVLNFSEKQTYS